MTRPDRTTFVNAHWKYFLFLEQKLNEISANVTFEVANSNTYSDSLASLMLDAGSELDTLCKLYLKRYMPNYNEENRYSMAVYAEVLLDNHPDVVSWVICAGGMMEYTPFKHWDKSKAAKSLPWWQGYNNVKHNRYENRRHASLMNCLNILSALYLLNMTYFKIMSTEGDGMDIPNQESRLFFIKNWETKCSNGSQMYYETVDEDYTPEWACSKMEHVLVK